MAIEGEAQFCGTGLDPLEMQLEQRHTFVWSETHRFDQVGPGGVKPHETALDQAFAPFGQRLAIGHDRAADAQHRAAAAILTRGKPQGADRHVESGIAIGVDPPDRPAIGAARITLDLVDQLHRPDLGRAGNRTAGKQRADHVDRAFARQQVGADRGGHGVDCRIALNRKGPFDLDRSGLCHARQVVAEQVDNHQVLGPVLDRCGEFLGKSTVLRGIAATRTRAFHRLGSDGAVLLGKEQFG